MKVFGVRLRRLGRGERLGKEKNHVVFERFKVPWLS